MESTAEIITCERCGAQFERQPVGRRPKCCRSCTTNRRRLDYEARRHTCSDCAAEVTRRVVNGPFPKFCEDCAKRRRSERNKGRYVPRPARTPVLHLCRDCPAPISDHATWCAECWRLRNLARLRDNHVRKSELRRGVCSDCREPFDWWAGHRTRRCEPCHARWQLDLRRSKNVSRRMRMASVDYEYLSRAAVFAECGWICGLCNEPVDAALTWPDPGSPTLDHIIPIAHGGGHVRSNVQLAHAICNARKGARKIEPTEGL